MTPSELFKIVTGDESPHGVGNEVNTLSGAKFVFDMFLELSGEDFNFDGAIGRLEGWSESWVIERGALLFQISQPVSF